MHRKVEPKLNYDAEIMAEMLALPRVKQYVDQMTPEEQAWYIALLVKNGVYQRFVLERQQQQIKDLWSGKDAVQ